MPRKNPSVGQFLDFRAILSGLVVKIIHIFEGTGNGRSLYNKSENMSKVLKLIGEPFGYFNRKQ